MLLVRVRERFHVRLFEWTASVLIIGLGLWMLAWPVVFERIGLAGFAELMHPILWQVAAIGIGAARIAALVLNGHRPRWSAPVRMAGALAGACFFAALATGFAMRSSFEDPSIGILTFLILALADLYSAARAAMDTAAASPREVDV